MTAPADDRFTRCTPLGAATAFVDRIISEEPRVGVKILMELLMLLNQRQRTVSGELMKCLDNQRLRIR